MRDTSEPSHYPSGSMSQPPRLISCCHFHIRRRLSRGRRRRPRVGGTSCCTNLNHIPELSTADAVGPPSCDTVKTVARPVRELNRSRARQGLQSPARWARLLMSRLFCTCTPRGHGGLAGYGARRNVRIILQLLFALLILPRPR